jgi:hypothetical protein
MANSPTSDAVFRRLARALPEVEEKSHFGKADFRVRNKIFAGFTDAGYAYVKLTPDQQDMICAAEPVVSPIKGGWGRQGWTQIDQARADEALLQSLLLTAWRNVAPKALQKGAGLTDP